MGLLLTEHRVFFSQRQSGRQVTLKIHINIVFRTKSRAVMRQNYGVFGDKFTLTYKQTVLVTTASTVTSRNNEVGVMTRVPAERTRVL